MSASTRRRSKPVLAAIWWLYGEDAAYRNVLYGPDELPVDLTAPSITSVLGTVSQTRGGKPFFTCLCDDLSASGGVTMTVQGGDGRRLPRQPRGLDGAMTANCEARYWYSLWVTRGGATERIGSGPFMVEHNPEYP